MIVNIQQNPKKNAMSLAREVSRVIDQDNNQIVIPSGSDANIFYGYLAKEINKLAKKSLLLTFIQGEELYPLPRFHPVSFSYQIKKRFSDKLKRKYKIIYLSNNDKNSKVKLNKFYPKFKNISPKIVIIGINTKGDLLGMDANKLLKNSILNITKLSKKKWTNYINVSSFPKKYISNTVPNLISLGLKTIIKSKKLYIIASGLHKKDIIKKLMLRKQNSAIGNLIKLRDKLGLETAFFIDKAAADMRKK